MSILSLPYPLFEDIILRQIEEKKREKSTYDKKLSTMKTANPQNKKIIRRR